MLRRRRKVGALHALPAASETSAVNTTAGSSPQKVIFATTFLHLLGFTMGGPLLPSLRQHFSLAATSTGLISSAFPTGVFVAVFTFPILSDIIGRKPVLIISYLGVGVGFILQSLAVKFGLSFRVFIALRVLSGCFAGASTVVKAYIADSASRESLPMWMAYRESAATLAFIIGPTLGGIVLACSSLSFAIFVIGLFSLAAGIFVAITLKPTKKHGPVQELEEGRASEHVAECPITWGAPWLPIVLTAVAGSFYNFGQSFFDSFFPILCAEHFGLSPPAIGSVQTCFATLVFLGTTCVYSRAVRCLGLVETASLGLSLISAGLILLGQATQTAVVAAVVLYAMGVPLFAPCVPTLLTRCAPSDRRGFVLGIGSAVNSVARIISPVLIGMIYGASPGRAFVVVGGVVAVGALLMRAEKSADLFFARR